MGGPFWAGKETAAWSIPKGLYDGDEDPWQAARREFTEETGYPVPAAAFFTLSTFRQPSGKLLTVFAGAPDAGTGAFDPTEISSNTFALEWPKGSRVLPEYPELDRAEWTSIAGARERLVKGQRPLLDALLQHLKDTEAEENRMR